VGPAFPMVPFLLQLMMETRKVSETLRFEEIKDDGQFQKPQSYFLLDRNNFHFNVT
jgi:hypothetical protein